MEQAPTVMPMTKEEFWANYWFSPLQMVTLINPKSYDYKFMVENRNFIIRAGANEKMPGTVANVYLSQMTRIMAQDDDKMSFLSDFALMRQYYDSLIVDVISLISEDHSQPAYLSSVPAHMRVESEPDTPPWQQQAAKAATSIPETNSDMTNTYDPNSNDTRPKSVAKPKAENKEFDLDGSKFKLVIDKNGSESHFKDGKRISAADYAKSASML